MTYSRGGRNMFVSVGCDPAAKNDFFAIAVVEGGREPDSTWMRALYVQRHRPVNPEEMAPLLLDVVLEMDQALPDDYVLMVAQDGSGNAQSMAARVNTVLKNKKKREVLGLSRRVPFKAMVIGGGSKIQPLVGGYDYEMSCSRPRLTWDFVIALNEGRIDMTGLDRESLAILEKEMSTFQNRTRGQTERLEHAVGEHDDTLFALAMAYWQVSSLLGKPGGGHYAASAAGLARPLRGLPEGSQSPAPAPATPAPAGPAKAPSGSGGIASPDDVPKSKQPQFVVNTAVDHAVRSALGAADEWHHQDNLARQSGFGLSVVLGALHRLHRQRLVERSANGLLWRLKPTG